MKLQFDAHQDYQLQAIQSIVDLFEGQPLNKGDFDISFPSLSQNRQSSLKIHEKGLGNQIVITPEQILQNLNTVQKRNNIYPSQELEGMNFTVEMETGTGKTYVYLRTIYELDKHYGFKKFVIVVPSIAIREGVLKNLAITHEHFQNLYNNTPLNYQVYNSTKLTGLRNFAVSNAIQVLVINIDSFAKDQNVINQVRETGIKPIEYIQATHPFVILDEPQNMETDKRKEAIANLNPAWTLRYSATHKHLYNLVYRLTPVDAYDLGLVKQIGVSSVISRDDYNAAYIKLEKFNRGKKRITAKISIYVNDKKGVVKKSFNVRTGDDLYELSNQRDVYKNKFCVNTLNPQHGYLEFSNGARVYEGHSQGGLTDVIMKEQIATTLKAHFDKELRFKQRGEEMKVLSLFFIDKVANYRQYDDAGNVTKGKFARWFEESFNELINKPEYKDLYPSFTAEQVHNGYFSQDRRGRFKDTTGTTQADDETFQLIMQDKERLLDNVEPLRFIFSHSALREGWDNPNVFQICTLNETQSDIKKRQEIGRGLRFNVINLREKILEIFENM
jgi:type III restriction enzyme